MTSSGWTRQHRCEYRQTTVQEPWGTTKQIIVQAPPVLREALHDLTDHGLLTRCAGLRPGPIDTPIASAKHTLRSLARRWMALAEEIALHDQHLARLTTATSPDPLRGLRCGRPHRG